VSYWPLTSGPSRAGGDAGGCMMKLASRVRIELEQPCARAREAGGGRSRHLGSPVLAHEWAQQLVVGVSLPSGVARRNDPLANVATPGLPGSGDDLPLRVGQGVGRDRKAGGRHAEGLRELFPIAEEPALRLPDSESQQESRRATTRSPPREPARGRIGRRCRRCTTRVASAPVIHAATSPSRACSGREWSRAAQVESTREGRHRPAALPGHNKANPHPPPQ